MRKLWPVFAMSLAACSDTSGIEAVQFQGASNFDFDDVATCISQDVKSVFPRLFPAGGTEERRTFRSYNGLVIDLRRSRGLVNLQLRWDRALNSAQEEYLRFCLEHAYKK